MTRKEKKIKLEERIMKEAKELIITVLEYYEKLVKNEKVPPKVAWEQAISKANSFLLAKIKKQPQEKSVIIRVGHESTRILNELLVEKTKELEARRKASDGT